TKQRFEIIIEGTQDTNITEESHWKAYEFKGKPGNLSRIPGQVAPYHLRLDWQMWFAAMSSGPSRDLWFRPLIAKLLKNEQPILNLIDNNPFPENPPNFIRARLFQYHF